MLPQLLRGSRGGGVGGWGLRLGRRPGRPALRRVTPRGGPGERPSLTCAWAIISGLPASPSRPGSPVGTPPGAPGIWRPPGSADAAASPSPERRFLRRFGSIAAPPPRPGPPAPLTLGAPRSFLDLPLQGLGVGHVRVPVLGQALRLVPRRYLREPGRWRRGYRRVSRRGTGARAPRAAGGAGTGSAWDARLVSGNPGRVPGPEGRNLARGGRNPAIRETHRPHTASFPPHAAKGRTLSLRKRNGTVRFAVAGRRVACALDPSPRKTASCT